MAADIPFRIIALRLLAESIWFKRTMLCHRHGHVSGQRIEFKLADGCSQSHLLGTALALLNVPAIMSY